jgi:hypothetical protein
MKNLKISGVLIYLFCFVLVLLLYFNFVFTPLSGKVSSLDLAHSANATQMQTYDRQISKIEDLKKKIAEMQSQIQQANTTAAVTGKNVSEDIGAAFTAAGITPRDISVEDEVPDKTKTSSDGKPLCSVLIVLKTDCTQTQMQTILNYFENQSSGVYYVNTVAYNTQDKLPYSLSLTLYYFGSKDTVGTSGTTSSNGTVGSTGVK